VKIQIRKSISKSLNSKFKVDFLTENFKFKLIKYKIHSIAGNPKALIDFGQWRIRMTQFSIFSFHFDHPIPALAFLFGVRTGAKFPEVRFFLVSTQHPHMDKREVVGKLEFN